jgi:hypothetical protein
MSNRFVTFSLFVASCISLSYYLASWRTVVPSPPIWRSYEVFFSDIHLVFVSPNAAVEIDGSFVGGDEEGTILTLRELPEHHLLQANNLSQLVIGPGSSLLTNEGPISVIRNVSSNSDGQLILRDVDATNFNFSCHEESILRIPFALIDNEIGYGFVNLTYSVVFPHSPSHGSPARIVDRPDRPTVFSAILPVFVDLPESLCYEIDRIILDNTSQDGGNNCDRESLIERLPQIVIYFPPPNRDALVLYPEDYVIYDETEGTCHFLINHVDEDAATLRFNPLIIPGVNLHVTSDHIQICDSVFGEQIQVVA